MGKIDDALEKLRSGDIEQAARDGVRESFERTDGELRIGHPDSPDREDYYDPDDDGWYTEYLRDAHEWALGECQKAVKRLRSAADPIPVEDYPALGLDQPDHAAVREQTDTGIEETADALEDVGEWRARLKRIEEAYRDR